MRYILRRTQGKEPVRPKATEKAPDLPHIGADVLPATLERVDRLRVALGKQGRVLTKRAVIEKAVDVLHTRVFKRK